MTTLDGSLSFSNLVVGAPNRLAVAAAKAVADAPGEAYNPLFVYGNPGLGKTHLAAAIAWQARESRPSLTTEITTGEELVEELNSAIEQRTVDSFTKRYHDVDLLVIDDVQFLAGQREVQSALLRLFNVMQGRGRQLVMTSDRPPEDIPDVDQRLISRLSGGLIADVGSPDFEMRLAILQRAAEERGSQFENGVLDEVARMAFGNVRELKGALNRLSAYSSLDGAAVQPHDVRAILGDRVRVERDSGAVGVLRADGTIAEYDGFLADITQEVEHMVEPWRVRIGEACTHYSAQGYKVTVLERAMTLSQEPDTNGLLETFASVVRHLRYIEDRAVALDSSLKGHSLFRDPEKVAEAESLLSSIVVDVDPLPAPDAQLTRDKLRSGSYNMLALQAFDEILESPGGRYNPLFVSGPNGSGKTHFANALANSYLHSYPGRSVACVSANTFMRELVTAMQSGGMEKWRARYRAADLLVVDDIQLLAAMERTQDELFHLFNYLFARGAQIVCTSDRSPAQLLGLADRLRSRLGGGLVAELRPPVEVEPAVLPESFENSVAVAMPPRIRPGELDTSFLDIEKMVWEWPDLSGRLVEELR